MLIGANVYLARLVDRNAKDRLKQMPPKKAMQHQIAATIWEARGLVETQRLAAIPYAQSPRREYDALLKTARLGTSRPPALPPAHGE